MPDAEHNALGRRAREASAPDNGWTGPKQGAQVSRLAFLAFTTNAAAKGLILPLIGAENRYLPGMLPACQPASISSLP